MKTTGWSRRFVITILLTLMVPIVLFAPQAYAESYVAGQIGVRCSHRTVGNGEVTRTEVPAGTRAFLISRCKTHSA